MSAKKVKAYLNILIIVVLFSFAHAQNSTSVSKTAIVSGQSVTGMVAAAILAKSGYQVDVYEVRDEYTRNIQWAGRQALVDELASIDQALADKFLETVARSLERGSIHINSDGTKKHYEQKGLRQGNATKVPSTAAKMMPEPSVMNMEGSAFEKLLKEYLDKQPNVKRHNEVIKFGAQDSAGNYTVAGHEKADLVVIAEGSGSKARDALKISSVPTSPSRLQVAGVIHIEGGGVMAKHWREEANDILLTGTMARKNSGKTWVVADIDPSKIVPAKEFGPTNSASYIRERRRLIDREFRRLASEAMEVPIDVAAKAKIEGAIAGRQIEPFELQQRISTRAVAGNNVVLLGDVVGNAHWSVGGGMQTGAVGHAENLKRLLRDLDNGVSRTVAFEKYSAGVLADTRAWELAGLGDYYPNLDRSEIATMYDESLELWKQGKISTPERAMQLMMPQGHLAKNVKAIKMPCNGIVRRILGEL